MGMTYPDLYTAIGVHSGLARGAASDLPSALAAMRQRQPAAIDAPFSAAKGQQIVPTIVFHGDQDFTVHAHNGDLVIAQSRTMTTTDLHTSVEYGRAPRGHAYCRTVHANAYGQPILEQWVIHEGGHAWSGGSPAGSYTDPRGPDAAQEMLRFFLGHALPAPAAHHKFCAHDVQLYAPDWRKEGSS
jgi:poly(3-hydroxybutyrate) depolymerase